MNGGRSIGANSRWRWEGAPLQQPSCGNAGGDGGCCDDGGYCVSGGGDSSMSMRAADERAAAEMLWRSHMSSQVMRDGGCGGAGGGGMGADAASGGRGSAPPTDVYSADFHGVSQIGMRMSADAPAFIPGGSAVPNGARAPPFEQESLWEEAESLWGCTSGAPPTSPLVTPGGGHIGASPRFAVPSSSNVSRIPSLQAMEAVSLNAAGQELWTQTSLALAPFATATMAALPSGFIGGSDGDIRGSDIDGNAHTHHQN